MARGWESKSVEEQMATAQQSAQPYPGNSFDSIISKRAAEQARNQRERQKQGLRLQKENILSQRTSNPARRAALESALAQIEAQLAELG
jgi:predicted component of type VI protein secretion system